MPKRYSYTDVVAMTNNFEEKLGRQGGLGLGQYIKGSFQMVA